MTEHLLIHITSCGADGFKAHWLLAQDHNIIAQSELAVPVAALPEYIPHSAAQRMITVFAGGVDVVIINNSINAKQRRHLKNILPYLVEESLAEDTAALHLAAGNWEKSSGNLPVAVMKKSLMQSLLSELRAANLLPHRIIPEATLMPYISGKWSMLYDGNMAWLRTSTHDVFAIEISMLPAMTGSLLHEKNQVIEVECFIPAIAQTTEAEETLVQLQKAHPQLSFHITHTASVLRFFFEQYVSHPDSASALNLLQGEFKGAAMTSGNRNIWIRLARIAAIWFVVQMAIDGGEALYLQHKSNELRAQSIAAYKSIFPNESKIIDPAQQMKNHLVHAGSPQAHGFLLIMQQLGIRWNAGDIGVLRIENMAYKQDGNILNMNIELSDMQTVNRLTQKINGGELTAKTVSVVKTKSGVKWNLSVAGKDK